MTCKARISTTFSIAEDASKAYMELDKAEKALAAAHRGVVHDRRPMVEAGDKIDDAMNMLKGLSGFEPADKLEVNGPVTSEMVDSVQSDRRRPRISKEEHNYIQSRSLRDDAEPVKGQDGASTVQGSSSLPLLPWALLAGRSSSSLPLLPWALLAHRAAAAPGARGCRAGGACLAASDFL